MTEQQVDWTDCEGKIVQDIVLNRLQDQLIVIFQDKTVATVDFNYHEEVLALDVPIRLTTFPAEELDKQGVCTIDEWAAEFNKVHKALEQYHGPDEEEE